MTAEAETGAKADGDGAPRFRASARIRRRGLLFVLSSPSGAGKTTLARRLLAIDPTLVISVSATTRPRREKERDGRDYHFMDIAAFQEQAAGGAFLEHAEVFGNFYATPRAPVEAWLAEGSDVLFDVDWQGARQLRAALPEDVVSVFILPPSLKALEDRLKKRGQDDPKVVTARMARASAEISHWSEYEYVIVNEDLDASEAALRAILAAERTRRTRQIGLETFAQGLVGGARS